MHRPLVRYLFQHRAGPQRWLRRLVPQPVLISLAHFRMYVELDDWAVGARIAVKRSYEPYITRLMRPLLQPGMVMVDVGANIGYYSLLAAERVGPSGKVLAFEPGARSVMLLEQSARANKFSCIQTHQMAVADQNGELFFTMDDSNGGIHRGEVDASAERVRAVALDDYLSAEPRVDLVKVDVEGAEGLAVRGMAQLLRRHRPVLFCEFTPAALPVRSGITAEAYLDLLREIGYQLRPIPHTAEPPAQPQSNAQIMQAFADNRNDHIDLLGEFG